MSTLQVGIYAFSFACASYGLVKLALFATFVRDKWFRG